MTDSIKMWKYLNEGNAHIVLHILNSKQVIRLIKECEKAIEFEVISNSVKYVNSIMIPLIFGEYNYSQELIQLSSDEIIELSTKMKEWRPKHRQVKSVISQYAIKAPNLTLLNTDAANYCIEIKPKEGFKAQSLELSQKCYYCLKQYLKFNNGEIKCVSNYCPLDLYSGVKARMKLALMSLFQNPQNNLKIFKNGEIIYNETSNMNDIKHIVQSTHMFASTNLFLDFIIHILSVSNNTVVLEETENVLIEAKPDMCNITNMLHKKSFLYKLLSVQRLCESVQYHIEKTNTEFKYVNMLFDLLGSNNFDLTNEDDKRKFLKMLTPQQLGLISAVAKDCSIMISFSTSADETLPFIIVNGKSIFYKVAVTDLEPKSIKSLEKRMNTENKLIEINKSLNQLN